MPAVFLQDIDITDVAKRGEIGNGTRQSDLLVVGVIGTDAERAMKGALQRFQGHVLGPIRPTEIRVDSSDIEMRRIVGNQILAKTVFD